MRGELSGEDAERLRAFERSGHDRLAGTYCDFFASVTALAIAPLLRAVHAAAGMRLLDVATGPGLLAAEANRRGCRPVGVDLSGKMLELARRLHPGIEFREADVESLPFADRTFDAATCSFGLGHFPRPGASVAECVRTLKPGARIAFAWWDDPGRQRIQGLFREAIAEVGVPPPAGVPARHSSLRFCERGEFLRLLRQADLMDVAVEGHETTHVVASADALWHGGLGSMVLTGAAIRAQDDATREIIRQAFERRAQAYKSANGFVIPIAFNVGVGRKPD
jgi:SAM-dependent methyltransferase